MKIAKFEHEKDYYDYLFTSIELFSQVKHLAKIILGKEGLEIFMKFRTQRLQTLPLDLLNTTSMVQHEGYSEEKTTNKTPEKENSPEREKSPEKEKSPEGEKSLEKEQTYERTSELLDTNVNIDTTIIKEWE